MPGLWTITLSLCVINFFFSISTYFFRGLRTHFIASKSTWNLSSAILKSKVQLIHFCSHHGHPYPPSKFKTSNPFFLCHSHTHIQLYMLLSTFVYNSPCLLLSQIFLDSSVPVITSTPLQIPPLCQRPSHSVFLHFLLFLKPTLPW